MLTRLPHLPPTVGKGNRETEIPSLQGVDPAPGAQPDTTDLLLRASNVVEVLKL